MAIANNLIILTNAIAFPESQTTKLLKHNERFES